MDARKVPWVGDITPPDSDRMEHASQLADLERENRALAARIRALDRVETLIGSSRAMDTVRERVRVVAASPTTTLVGGETGVGKDLVAREIHRLSGSRRSLIKLDCATTPHALLERELFGEKDHPGLLGRLHGGTLLLDDVDRLPLAVQSRLVQTLDAARDAGEADDGRLPRIVSTCRIDLKRSIERGDFREDFYYRINIVPIHIPPLRERREDIPLLAAHFLRELCGESADSAVRLTPEAVDKLRKASWRGNVRELKNVIERAVLLSYSPMLGPDDLRFDSERDEEFAQMERVFRFGSFRDMEKLMILSRLRDHNDNRTHASRSLEISVRTLRNKLREYRETGNTD